MKRWAILTAFIYFAVLMLLAAPAVFLAFHQPGGFDDLWNATNECNVEHFYLIAAIPISIAAILQLALLVVPVRIANRRPVQKRHVFWTILAAMIATIILAVGAGFAVFETLQGTKDLGSDNVLLCMGGFACLWMVWTFIFGFYTGNREPKTMMSRLARFLIAGSTLELLIAVPAHIIARCRDQCCGGILTFVGLACGTAIMLFAFGPGVFILLAKRVQSLKPPQKEEPKNQE